jgi:hypothetical protein
MTDTLAPDEERLRVLYGDPALAPPARTPLRAGPLTLVYTDLGDLRYVRLGRHEIVRRLYHAVRDERWGTVPAGIEVTERTVGPDSFRIAYTVRHADPARGIAFVARVTLTGVADGTVTYDFDGAAETTFARNRIGICVLHPAQDCKGLACRVTHTDGAVEDGAFPDLISPHQPFFDIAAIAHAVGDTGATATIEFSGDVFEMEDQRNWLDASYKTYSTPLALPLPVEVTAGTRIRQTVTLRLSDLPASPLPPADDRRSALTPATGEGLPGPYWTSIGLMLPRDGRLPESAFLAVRRLRPSFFYLNLDAAKDDIPAALSAADATLKALNGRDHGFGLTVGLRNARLLPEGVGLASAAVGDWHLLNPDEQGVERARERLGDSAPLVPASAANFTELNRSRPDMFVFEHGVCWAANPQVHAFDTLSIMETPPMLEEARRTAESFDWRTGKQYGPLTFYGPYRGEDARQQGLVGAAWYVAMLCHTASCSDPWVTLCEVVGSRGVVDEQGRPFPVYHALTEWLDVARLQHGTWEPFTGDTDRVSAAALWPDDDGPNARVFTFVVNRTPDEQIVTVRGLNAARASVRVLDETNALTGFSDPRPLDTPGGEATLTLLPYAIAEVVTALSPGPSPAAVEGSLGRVSLLASPTAGGSAEAAKNEMRERYPSPAAGEGPGERA